MLQVNDTVAFYRDEQLMNRAGPDGLLYVKFQRHLILLTAVMVVTSLCIAMPINMSGEIESQGSTFAHTTLSNLGTQSPLMWIHTILTWLYLPIGAYIIHRFSKQVRNP